MRNRYILCLFFYLLMLSGVCYAVPVINDSDFVFKTENGEMVRVPSSYESMSKALGTSFKVKVNNEGVSDFEIVSYYYSNGIYLETLGGVTDMLCFNKRDSLSTNRGIRVGDTIDTVEDAYGPGISKFIEGYFYIMYKPNNNSLKKLFVFIDLNTKCVSEIQVQSRPYSVPAVPLDDPRRIAMK